MRIAPIKKPVEETHFVQKVNMDNMHTHSSYNNLVNYTYEELITKLQETVASLGMTASSLVCYVCGDPWYATIDDDYDQAFDLCKYHFDQVS